MNATTSEERDLRQNLAAAYRLIALDGMDDGIDTHISARLPGERFLLNAYGLRFAEVRADNLVTVDADGKVLDDPTGLGINPAGFTIHSALHAARPDVNCVMHCHTVAGVAISCLEEGLLPLNQWALQFHDRLAYHDFEGIALELDERERLAEDLGDHAAMILRQHGLLTCGRSVGEAFLRMRNLERSCQTQLAAQATGQPLRLASPTMAEHVAQQFDAWATGPAGSDRAWQAELRRLSGADDSL
ncbi:ribulose-5-phosphate 4-epimerase/fuculose-1-phosphate aldolase [Marinobacter sp. LV10R520-4]|jgi:ribulose-5-phosphate 4-epimerase/fuculose-1-phosphate aldolase|uniref:class II aldolase/adducin family protein n=1 Tax=Marinobacter sp. LV10R520-4 TaxID=1761796 RepID=UPI000BF584C9|nr:class II aldolase/adducin family protein [Marinobacter sp. LV10R520-4]PFG54665.1 ribulose-5-phosphate 4-epimerase/fuculose-1-phosphate aldolase [Marinobacter sp. LV10R520-4]